METILTKDDIVNGLKSLGLKPGSAIEVHSSLSSMGYVEGGASTVIKALIEVVGEQGAIVMPADPISPLLPLTEGDKARGIYAKVRFLDENVDCKTGMGVIADTFRHWPDTYLGKGIHRVCAWGQDAELFIQRRYEHLLTIDGSTLLIGVDIHRCSSMHIAEDKVPLPQELLELIQMPESIQQELEHEYPSDEYYVEYNGPQAPVLDDAWGKVTIEAERRGLIRRGTIGQAECMLFKTKPVIDIYEDFLRNEPYQLFGIG